MGLNAAAAANPTPKMQQQLQLETEDLIAGKNFMQLRSL
jgi:hypothetical protein